ADHLDFACFPGLFDGGNRSQRRRIVDGEDGVEIRMPLNNILRGGERFVAGAAAGEASDDLNAPRLGGFFAESFGAHHDRFGFGLIEYCYVDFAVMLLVNGSTGDLVSYVLDVCVLA